MAERDAAPSADRAHTHLPQDVILKRHGVDQLRAMIDGEFPGPAMATTLAFRLVEAGEGLAIFHGEPTHDFLNPMGVVHGGWASAILDSALGCAVHATLEPGETYATLELKVNLTRAIRPDSGRYTARGVIVTRGRRVGLSEARLTDAKGRICAHGTSTCLITSA